MVALCPPPHVEHTCLPEHTGRLSQLQGRVEGAQGRFWLNAAQVGSPPPPAAASVDREESCWQARGVEGGVGWEVGMAALGGGSRDLGRDLVTSWRMCWKTIFSTTLPQLLYLEQT